MGDRLTKEQRSFNMSRIRSKDTAPELKLRSALHARGLRFRKHVSGLPGKPDIAFPGIRVAVFVDGDFWHGYRFHELRLRLSPYWEMRIQRNIERDVLHRALLRSEGWSVIRVWEHQVNQDLDAVANRLEHLIKHRQSLKKHLVRRR